VQHRSFRVTGLLAVLSILATLLAARMPSSDERSCARVPHSASDYRAACRTLGPTVIVLLFLRFRVLALLRLLALGGLLVLRLLLGRRRR
jgi:hypothetical protein